MEKSIRSCPFPNSVRIISALFSCLGGSATTTCWGSAASSCDSLGSLDIIALLFFAARRIDLGLYFPAVSAILNLWNSDMVLDWFLMRLGSVLFGSFVGGARFFLCSYVPNEDNLRYEKQLSNRAGRR